MTSLNNYSSAGHTAAYLKLPIVLTNAACCAWSISPTLPGSTRWADLYVDACVCDEQRNLVFLSAWGRDTVTQEFLATLTLGREENGIDHFHIIVDGRCLPVFPNQFRGTLFGVLVEL